MEGSEDAIQSLPEVSVRQHPAHRNEGHAFFKGNGPEFLIQGFPDMFQYPFRYIFFPVRSGPDIPLYLRLGAGEAEGPFDGGPGYVIRPMAGECQFLQFPAAGEGKAQGYPYPVDELAGGMSFESMRVRISMTSPFQEAERTSMVPPDM